MIWNAVIADLVTYPWFALVLAVVLIGLGRKGMIRLAKYVGGAYWGSHH